MAETRESDEVRGDCAGGAGRLPRNAMHPPASVPIDMSARTLLSIDTLWSLDRVGSLCLAPDASAAVCAVATPSMKENKTATSLWLLPTASRREGRTPSASSTSSPRAAARPAMSSAVIIPEALTPPMSMPE